MAAFTSPRMRRLGAAIVEAAHRACSLESWQRDVFAIVSPVGFDVAFLETKAPSPRFFGHGLDARVVASVRPRWPVFERELRPVTEVSVRDGVAVDTDVLGSSRERCAYYQELVRPHRGAHSLLAHLGLGGRAVGGLMLGRTGAPFRDADRALVRALVAPLAVGLAALHAGVPSRVDAAVTPREHEVLELVRLGYQNREIARALGTSPNTVRNQVASLFAKLGATTRAELAGLAP